MQEMIYRTKVHTRGKVGHRSMDAAAYVREHPKMIQRTVHCCLERARLCTETISNSYKMYLIKFRNEVTSLILSLIVPCTII
jgi:hypothetical protein